MEEGLAGDKGKGCLKWGLGCGAALFLAVALVGVVVMMNWDRVMDSEFGRAMSQAKEGFEKTIMIVEDLEAEYPNVLFSVHYQPNLSLNLMVTKPTPELMADKTPMELAAFVYSRFQEIGIEVDTVSVSYEQVSVEAARARRVPDENHFRPSRLIAEFPELFGAQVDPPAVLPEE